MLKPDGQFADKKENALAERQLQQRALDKNNNNILGRWAVNVNGRQENEQ